MSSRNGTVVRALGRDALSASTLKTKRIRVKEWDGEIILRELSAAQTADLAGFSPAGGGDLDPKAALRVAAWAIVAAWVDEEGDQVLTAADIDTLLSTQTPDVINRLSGEVMALSGIGPRVAEQAEKNSESRQNEDSGTP